MVGLLQFHTPLLDQGTNSRKAVQRLRSSFPPPQQTQKAAFAGDSGSEGNRVPYALAPVSGRKAAAPAGSLTNMKNGVDSTAVERVQESETFTNRKLIRPSLNRDLGRSIGVENTAIERRERAERGGALSASRKTPPPEQTHAENFYYQKQMQSKTPMVIVLQDGEEIHGIIEWYDRSCIKITRGGQSNLLIYKPSIKYMYKESEANGRK